MAAQKVRKLGHVILFHAKRPMKQEDMEGDLSGSFVSHRKIKKGEKLSLSLWLCVNDEGEVKVSDEGKQYSTGNIKDPWVPQNKTEGEATIADTGTDLQSLASNDDDDFIPF